jgi:hypothetical protein
MLMNLNYTTGVVLQCSLKLSCSRHYDLRTGVLNVPIIYIQRFEEILDYRTRNLQFHSHLNFKIYICGGVDRG